MTNKLERSITLGRKGLPYTNALVFSSFVNIHPGPELVLPVVLVVPASTRCPSPEDSSPGANLIKLFLSVIYGFL